MGKHHTPTGRASSLPGGLALGAGTGMAVTLGMAALLAKLVDGGTMLWENVGYGIMAALLMASFCGAQTACMRIRRQYLLVSGLSGLLYFGLLLSMTALFFGGQYQAVGVTALLILAGCGASGLLNVQRSRRGRGGTWKRAYR